MIFRIFHYILSYFYTPKPDLSLDEAYDILNQDRKLSDAENITSPCNDGEIEDYDSFIKTGTITNVKNNNEYTVDNLYEFTTNLTIFQVGARVSYNLLVTNGEVKITNVKVIQYDWDIVDTAKTSWCDRTIITKVKQRIGRVLYFTNEDNSKVDLDNIDVEFLPVVGDWVELEVKCEINESVNDLSGTVLEITKVLPVRAHVKTGFVIRWDWYENVGTIDNNVFFKKDSLSCGYVPVVGDRVVAELIESDQNRCCWRALKILPDFLVHKSEPSLNHLCELDYVTEHPSVYFNNTELLFCQLNDLRLFKVVINNSTGFDLTFTKAEFSKATKQCKILDGNVKKIIPPGCSHELTCQCIAKNMGSSADLLLLYLQDVKSKFKFGKWVKINVEVNTGRNLIGTNDRHWQKPSQCDDFYSQQREVVRGQRISTAPRFIAVKSPDYTVPGRLLRLITKNGSNDALALTEELKTIKPSLFANLTYQNYEDKFHGLLHLDEIVSVLAMRNYDQEKACFVKNHEFLMLDIDNLSERRPSVIVGDKVIARDPNNPNKMDYEGIVHKTGAKHVYLKFSQIFHDVYNGDDYSIRIIGSRTSYRRMHHAIHLALRNLGKEILFTTRVSIKNPQVNLDQNWDNNSPERKKLTPRAALKNIQEYKMRKSLHNNTLPPDLDPPIQIEWHNQFLNFYQKEAVKNILLGVARPLPYIIFGPPGTGKTVTIIETILQLVRLVPQSRLLVTAPSNSAADLIALKLIDSGVLKPGDLVRLVSNNYVASDLIVPRLVPYCATGSAAKVGTEQTTVTSSGLTLGCNSAVLGRHRITVSTCGSAGLLYAMGFPKGHFSHIIVDEAGQTAEPEVMIPLVFLDVATGQIILAGDPLQLGPVVLCKIASECGLYESYLERLINRFPYIRDSEGFPKTGGYDPRLVTKLLYNYRSLETLLKLTSSLFYNSDLIPTISNTDSDEIVLLHKLTEILPPRPNNQAPCIVFHGVNGENYQTPDSPSWFNPHEAAQIFYYTNEMYRLGLFSKDLGIITPYTKQVKEIRSLLTEAEFDLPKIGTVEEFQGQEFNVVLLSTVRSCQDYVKSDILHSLGFVSSPRRLNVALSRAKVLLIIVGNPNLLCNDFYWRTVIKYCLEHGGYTGCDLNL